MIGNYKTYTHDVHSTITSHSEHVFFPETDYFHTYTNNVLASLNTWFKVNKLTLNFDKINYMKLAISNKTYILHTVHDNKTKQEQLNFLASKLEVI